MYIERLHAGTFLWFISLVLIHSGASEQEAVKEAEKSVLFLILSQDSVYDGEKAAGAHDSIKKQAEKISNLRFAVLRTSVEFNNIVGSWAIWPLLNSVHEQWHGNHFDWIWLGEPDTKLDVTSLLDYLSAFDKRRDHFIGRALRDKSPTIIHHFFGYENPDIPFLYPDFAAGLVLSWKTWKQLVRRVKKDAGFTIDAKHEFAKLLRDVIDVHLTNVPRFCLLANETHCISRYAPSLRKCERNVKNGNIYFAVKTFSGNHKTRIPVIKNTWGKDAVNIIYYSDQKDESIPTISIGIKNTERGHCAKTFAILKHYLRQSVSKQAKWICIADDDTLISISRLATLLSCYDAEDRLIIGERYGYGFDSDGREGYDYPTGGAGMIFTRKAAENIVSRCYCPGADSPDDMIIGMCARKLQIPVIHSAAFHQARPIDYSDLYLQRLKAISFHKFDEIDPYEAYKNLVYDESLTMEDDLKHIEL